MSTKVSLFMLLVGYHSGPSLLIIIWQQLWFNPNGIESFIYLTDTELAADYSSQESSASLTSNELFLLYHNI